MKSELISLKEEELRKVEGGSIVLTKWVDVPTRSLFQAPNPSEPSPWQK